MIESRPRNVPLLPALDWCVGLFAADRPHATPALAEGSREGRGLRPVHTPKQQQQPSIPPPLTVNLYGWIACVPALSRTGSPVSCRERGGRKGVLHFARAVFAHALFREAM